MEGVFKAKNTSELYYARFLIVAREKFTEGRLHLEKEFMLFFSGSRAGSRGFIAPGSGKASGGGRGSGGQRQRVEGRREGP